LRDPFGNHLRIVQLATAPVSTVGKAR